MSLLRKAARVGLGGILMFTGVGHLTFVRDEFQAQVPSWFPVDEDLTVVASGFTEIAIGASLIALPKQRRVTGLVAALFFVAIFPGNIGQFVDQSDGFGLNSDTSRFLRLLFQPVLVLWALFAGGYWSKDEQESLPTTPRGR